MDILDSEKFDAVHGCEAAPGVSAGDLLKVPRTEEIEVDVEVEDPYNPINEETILSKLPDEVFASVAKFMDPTSYFNTKAICQFLKWKCERVERTVIVPIHEITFLSKDQVPNVVLVEAKGKNKVRICHELPGTRLGLTINSFYGDEEPLSDELLDKIDAFLQRRTVTITNLFTEKITCSLERFKKFTEKYSIKKIRCSGEIPVCFLDFMQDKIMGLVGEDDFSQLLPGGMDYYLKTQITCGDVTFPPNKPFTATECRRLIDALNAGRIHGHVFFRGTSITNFADIFTGMHCVDFEQERDYGQMLTDITTRPIVFRSSLVDISAIVTKDDNVYLVDGALDDHKVFVLHCHDATEIKEHFGFDGNYSVIGDSVDDDEDESDDDESEGWEVLENDDATQ